MTKSITKQCAGCGSAFEPVRTSHKYCTPECRLLLWRKRSADRLAKRPTECAECGEDFDPPQFGAPKKYCTRKCAQKAGNRRNRRQRSPLRRPTERQCDYCGATYTARNRNSRFCPDAWCRQYAYQERKRKGEPNRQVPHDVTCDECGSVFTGIHPDARWCSKQCANRYWGRVRVRQHNSASRLDYTDLEVFERDNWTCHLCGEPVDPELDRTHEKGATIDHITPISRGGVDELDNVALAHWCCNREKGSSVSQT